MRAPRQSKSDRNSPKSSSLPPAGTGTGCGSLSRWPQGFKQAVGQAGRVEDCAKQNERLPCVLFARSFQQNLTHLRIAGKPLRALQKPDVELSFRGTQVRDEFGVITLRVID